jgi:hypothetical protein
MTRRFFGDKFRSIRRAEGTGGQVVRGGWTRLECSTVRGV